MHWMSSVTTEGGTSDPIALIVADPFPDLSIRSTHSGNFGAGFEGTYSVTVKNVGRTHSGAITVTGPASPGIDVCFRGWDLAGPVPEPSRFLSARIQRAPAERIDKLYADSCRGRERIHQREPFRFCFAVDGDLNGSTTTPRTSTDHRQGLPGFCLYSRPLVPGQQATVAVRMPTPFPHDVTGSIALTFASNAVIPVGRSRYPARDRWQDGDIRDSGQ